MMHRRIKFGFLLMGIATLALAGGLISSTAALDDGEDGPPTTIEKKGVDIELRSEGKMMADSAVSQLTLSPDPTPTPVPGENTTPNVKVRGSNLQVSDGGLDNIQIFAGFRPFVKSTQSETTISASNNDIVVSYNSSANQPLAVIGGVLQFTSRFLSGYSSSHDGGQTWSSGFVPPLAGSIFTFGDGVVAQDRNGNFYYATLGANASGRTTVQVNKSTDGGSTFGVPTIVQVDNGGDKEWIGVGPSPSNKNQDNVYVTWTSFQASGQQLRFGRSTDGGQTWTSTTIFAPGPDVDPTHPQNSLSFTSPVVDPFNGRLYIPFAQFSNSDTDFLRVLISDDAGATFHFATFNVPGAPSPTLLPVVQPGELIDCFSGGFRLSIHAGPPLVGRFGLRTFQKATRLIIQPTLAVRNGVVYMAWNNSDGTVFGDPATGSNILFVRSDDGGNTWSSPTQVNPAVSGDIHHVHPALAIDVDPNDVHISYYTQHADGTVDLDMANSHDRGATFPSYRTVRVTEVSSTLAPTNMRLSATTSTNYDRTIQPCYSLGEYNGITTANGNVYATWGDLRNTVTQPVNVLDPISGQTHTQQDVRFQKVKAQ